MENLCLLLQILNIQQLYNYLIQLILFLNMEALLELLIITASQIAEEYKDCDVVLNQGVPEIKKVRPS